MELEKLEVLLEINTKNVQESINRVLPQINGLLKKIQDKTDSILKLIMPFD